MSIASRSSRLARRIATAVHQVEHTDQVVTTSETQLAQLRETLEAIRATMEASFESELEALSFLTRSINDLSSRLGKLELAADDTEG